MRRVGQWVQLKHELKEGDMVGGLEYKTDFKEVGKSFTLNKDVWAKATTDAIRNNDNPAIVVVLGEEGIKTRLAVIELSLLEMILDLLPPDSV